MANIKSQIKRNKQNEKRHERNKAVKTGLKSAVHARLRIENEVVEEGADHWDTGRRCVRDTDGHRFTLAPVQVGRLYLDLPLVDGQPMTDRSHLAAVVDLPRLHVILRTSAPADL